MTTITDPRQLPWSPLRLYDVKDEAEAVKIANGRKAYLYQMGKALCLFVETLTAESFSDMMS